MEQRRLRLGDILDDYCPRERRVTNHAIVAMIEEDVKQTRCTTCDSEHAYKGGKEPRRRKKDAAAVLYKEVLAGMPEVPEAVITPPEPQPEPVVVAPVAMTDNDDNGIEAPPEPVDEEPAAAETRVDSGDDGFFHRRLIRATLPRPEGQKEVRQIPEFTIRQNGRGNGHSGFRGKMRAQGGNNGGRPQGGRRFGPPGAGQGHRPAGPGGTGGRPGMRSHRNRKRSR
jgi:hypothetical protein